MQHSLTQTATARVAVPLFCLLGLLLLLPGCMQGSARLASDHLSLQLIVMRYNDDLVVQATLHPVGQPDERLELSGGDHLTLGLNDQTTTLTAQWNQVYSTHMGYEPGELTVNLIRSQHRSAVGTRLSLPDRPRFVQPAPDTLFRAKPDTRIQVHWQGQPSGNGRFDLLCPSAGNGFKRSTGQFPITSQALTFALDELFSEQGWPAPQQLCQLELQLTGITQKGRLAAELGGGSMRYESHVTRRFLIYNSSLPGAL